MHYLHIARQVTLIQVLPVFLPSFRGCDLPYLNLYSSYFYCPLYS